jgi:prophage regulatory protein
MESFVRISEAAKRLGLSKATLYRYVKAGTMPAPVTLGAASVAFVESELAAWIEARIKASRDPKADKAA